MSLELFLFNMNLGKIKLPPEAARLHKKNKLLLGNPQFLHLTQVISGNISSNSFNIPYYKWEDFAVSY